MSEETIDTGAPAATGERPTFLTVVCILSFIGIGFALIGYIMLIAAMGVVEAGVSNLENAVTEAGGTVTSSGPGTGMAWTYIIVGFLCAIVSLVGVIKMWKLQKQGFMLYTAASVIMIILGFVTYGFSVGIIFPIAFIAMYYANLKHMS